MKLTRQTKIPEKYTLAQDVIWPLNRMRALMELTAFLKNFMTT